MWGRLRARVYFSASSLGTVRKENRKRHQTRKHPIVFYFTLFVYFFPYHAIFAVRAHRFFFKLNGAVFGFACSSAVN